MGTKGYLLHVQGWICNSSICMTRRGMKPTGIAIFEAQQKGFPSVAHFVQVQRCPLVAVQLPPPCCTPAMCWCASKEQVVEAGCDTPL